MIPFNKTTLVSVLFILVSACSKPQNEVDPEVYNLEIPSHFPVPKLDTDNPMNADVVQLGRKLFYDVRLSSNNKVSCASCHDPKRAFTDGVSLSNAGVSATSLLRHTPALFNLAWIEKGFFWDGGSTNLESQVFGPLTAHDEMAQNLYELIDELNAVPEYVTSFKKAFDQTISSQNVAKALAQFQRTLISAGSRYDQYRLNKATLTNEELAGRELVRQKCQSCHRGELFTDGDFHNNGLDTDFSNSAHEGLYQGRSRITYDPMDLGKYKTPSLRNVELTAPYMHDGRYMSLEQVLDHYSTGIKVSLTLDSQLPASGMNLSAREKTQIISFLHTLTDHKFVQNPSHQKPIVE